MKKGEIWLLLPKSGLVKRISRVTIIDIDNQKIKGILVEREHPKNYFRALVVQRNELRKSKAK